MSSDPKRYHFSDGMTEDIIAELGRFREFLVIARSSSFQFRSKANDVTEVAKIVPAIFDLSTALGLSGQFDHPEVLAARSEEHTSELQSR